MVRTTVGIIACVLVGVSAAVTKMPSEATLTVQHDWPAPSCICCSRLQEDASDSAARAPGVQPVAKRAGLQSFILFVNEI